MTDQRTFTLPSEDNYPEYVRRHFGYSYSTMLWTEPNRHRGAQHILNLDEAALLEQCQTAQSDDFLELAMAHALLARHHTSLAIDVLERIVESPPYDASIAYDELMEELVLLCLGEHTSQHTARAETAITTLSTHFPAHPRQDLLRGLIHQAQLGDDDTLSESPHFTAYLDADTEDLERYYDVAERLALCGHLDAAMQWAERTREVAKAHTWRALHTDAVLLLDSLSILKAQREETV